MTDAKSFDIDSRKLFNLGANLLIAGFVKQKTEEAKKLFKELKQGALVPSGHLSSEKTGIKLPIKLQLERSEYRGQFNFPNFEASLKIMLQKFENEARRDPELKDLRTLTNQDTGGILFNIPSGMKIGEEMNVLMMAAEPVGGSLVIKLMFMDPDQFKNDK